MTTWSTLTSAPSMVNSTVFWLKKTGNWFVVWALNILLASVDRKNDAPIALIRKASLGAPRCRSGR